MCKIVTEGFQEISLEIQSIEKTLLEDLQRADHADLVRRLQDAEKLKLKEVSEQ